MPRREVEFIRANPQTPAYVDFRPRVPVVKLSKKERQKIKADKIIEEEAKILMMGYIQAGKIEQDKYDLNVEILADFMKMHLITRGDIQWTENGLNIANTHIRNGYLTPGRDRWTTTI